MRWSWRCRDAGRAESKQFSHAADMSCKMLLFLSSSFPPRLLLSYFFTSHYLNGWGQSAVPFVIISHTLLVLVCLVYTAADHRQWYSVGIQPLSSKIPASCSGASGFHITAQLQSPLRVYTSPLQASSIAQHTRFSEGIAQSKNEEL